MPVHPSKVEPALCGARRGKVDGTRSSSVGSGLGVIPPRRRAPAARFESRRARERARAGGERQARSGLRSPSLPAVAVAADGVPCKRQRVARAEKTKLFCTGAPTVTPSHPSNLAQTSSLALFVSFMACELCVVCGQRCWVFACCPPLSLRGRRPRSRRGCWPRSRVQKTARGWLSRTPVGTCLCRCGPHTVGPNK